jgi:hypothetical protein
MRLGKEALYSYKTPIKVTVFSILKVSFTIVRKHTSWNVLEFLSFELKTKVMFIASFAS